MVCTDRKRNALLLHHLRIIQQQVLDIETRSNDDRRVSRCCRRITLSRHDQTLQLDELTEAGLLVRICEIATSGADEADVRNVCAFGGFNEFLCDLHLLLGAWWDQTDGVGTS